MGPLGAAARRRRALLALWLGAGVVLGSVLVATRSGRSALDDPDPARQRPGLLDAGPLPRPAPVLADGLPQRGRPAVVFFVRPGTGTALCRSLARSDLGRRAQVAMVGPVPVACEGVVAVADEGGRLAAAYGLPRPRAGGYPVGYAVVDGSGRIRYRTLDPAVAANLAEVATMVRALP